MPPIQPRSLGGGDKELRPIGVGPGVGHGKHPLCVGNLEVLVIKFLAPFGQPAGSISPSEVAALDHEVRNDSMERRALVRQLSGSVLSDKIVSSAQFEEILDGFGGGFAEESDGDGGLDFFVVDGDGDGDAFVDGGVLGGDSGEGGG